MGKPKCPVKYFHRESMGAHGVFTKQLTERRPTVAYAALCNLLSHMQQKVAANLTPVRDAFP